MFNTSSLIILFLLNSIKDGKNEDFEYKREISSAQYCDKVMMCCANNTEGEECSQLYDYGNSIF